VREVRRTMVDNGFESEKRALLEDRGQGGQTKEASEGERREEEREREREGGRLEDSWCLGELEKERGQEAQKRGGKFEEKG
jgi:hypothetical protein